MRHRPQRRRHGRVVVHGRGHGRRRGPLAPGRGRAHVRHRFRVQDRVPALRGRRSGRAGDGREDAFRRRACRHGRPARLRGRCGIRARVDARPLRPDGASAGRRGPAGRGDAQRWLLVRGRDDAQRRVLRDGRAHGRCAHGRLRRGWDRARAGVRGRRRAFARFAGRHRGGLRLRHDGDVLRVRGPR